MWMITHMIMVMIMMKTVQMTINEELLSQIDQIVKDQGSNRSAFMRQALEEALRRYNVAKLEKVHANGYLKQPIKTGEFNNWQGEQVWGNEWNEER